MAAMKSLSRRGPDERPDDAGSFDEVDLPVALLAGSNVIECQHNTLANRGATPCVSLDGADALGSCSAATFVTEQGLPASSAPEPACIVTMFPGLDATGALIRKQYLRVRKDSSLNLSRIP
jgi:hypothetical protein